MDIKPLEKLQKELYKSQSNARDSRMEGSGDELPVWYEITESGGLRFKPGILAITWCRMWRHSILPEPSTPMTAAYTKCATIFGGA